MPDAPRTPGPARQVQPQPLRLFHLMALVAAAAITLFVPPALMPVLRSAFSWAEGAEQLIDQISVALTLWAPILALIAAFGARPRLRRAARSYGISAALASAAALSLLFARNLSWGFLQVRRGNPFFPEGAFRGGSPFCPAAAQLVRDAPGAAAAAILAVWSILALTGAGRWPSGWFDRACLLFGLSWILWYFVRDFMLLFRW